MLKLDESVNAKDAWLKQVKHHRRRLKGLPRVGFNPDAGNVEHNINMMNKMLGSGEMLSNNPISGPFGGDVSAPAGGTSMGESFDNKNNSKGFDMVDEIRRYVLELVQAEYETGHILSDDYNSFKKLVADDGYRATKSMYEFYLECRELGPAGFLAQYKDELDFDSMFILEYGDNEESEDEDENIEESLTEKTNMEKLRSMYPELAESVDEAVIYPNGVEVREDSVDLDKALDYMYGTDRDPDNTTYTEEEKQRAIDYWIKKTDPSPYEHILNEDTLNEINVGKKIQKNRDKATKKAQKLSDKLKVHADKVIQNDTAHKDAKTWQYYILDKHGNVKNKYSQVEFLSKFRDDDRTRYNALVVDRAGNIVRRGTEWLYNKGYKFYPKDANANIPLEKYTYEGAYDLPPFFVSKTKSPRKAATGSTARSEEPKVIERDPPPPSPQPVPKRIGDDGDEDPNRGRGKGSGGGGNGSNGNGSGNGGGNGNGGGSTNNNNNNISIANNVIGGGGGRGGSGNGGGSNKNGSNDGNKDSGNNGGSGSGSGEGEAKLSDDILQKTIEAGKVFDLKFNALYMGDKVVLTDEQLKKLNMNSKLDRVWVSKSGKDSNATLLDTVKQMKLKHIIEQLVNVSGDLLNENLDEKVITHDSLIDSEMKELLSLAQEIGINTLGELEEFANKEVPQGTSLLDYLRQYRDDLGDDFVVKEELDYSPETEIDSYDEVDDISWFNR